MALKSKTFWFPIRRWFPPSDPIARSIARLCILREDLYIEYLGIAAESPLRIIMPSKWGSDTSLDDNGEHWRRLYFLRNTLKTLYEIKSALSSLHDDPDFRRMLRNDDSHFDSEFLAYLKKLDENLQALKRLRHVLGGHVSRDGVKRALEIMDFDNIGTLESGRLEKDTHYGFVRMLCVRMFYIGVDLADAEQYTLKIVHLLDKTLNIIGNVLGLYLSNRKLI